MKKKTALSIFISALFLYIALRGISFSELLSALKKCNYLYLIPAFLVMCSLFVIRTLRWHYLVKPIKPVGFKNLFSATMIGFMANNIFPARIGEFVRANILGNDEKISKSSVFATIVIERLFDGMSILLILVVTFLTVDIERRLTASVADKLKFAAYASLALYIVIIALIVLLNYRYEMALKIVSFFLKPFPKTFGNYINKLLESFRSGLKIEKDFRNISIIIFYSLLHWILCAFPIYIILIGFGYDLPAEASYVVLIMMTFAVMVPAAPGYIGTLNAAVMYALTFYGLSEAEGFSVSVLVHMVNFFPPVVLGIILLWVKNISLRKLEETSQVE